MPWATRTDRRHPQSSTFKDFIFGGWAERPESPPTPRAQAPYAADRRARISAMHPGERLIVPAGPAKQRSNDTDYPYRAHSAFSYLTGWGSDSVPGSRARARARPPTATTPRSTCCRRPAATPRSSTRTPRSASSGPVRARALAARRRRPRPRDPAPRRVRRRARRDRRHDAHRAARPTATSPISSTGAVCSPPRTGRSTRSTRPATPTSRATSASCASSRTTTRSARCASRSTPPSRASTTSSPTSRRSSPTRAASASSRARSTGAPAPRATQVGYDTIAASGPHACILHWTRNDGPVNDGDLILLDAGIELDTLYTADITRTLPICGTFTEVQRRVYEAVLEAADAARAIVQAGHPVPRGARRGDEGDRPQDRRVGLPAGERRGVARRRPAVPPPLHGARHEPPPRDRRARLRAGPPRAVPRRRGARAAWSSRSSRACTSSPTT